MSPGHVGNWDRNSVLSPRNVDYAICNDQVMMTVVKITVTVTLTMVMMIMKMTMMTMMMGRCEQMVRATAMGRGEVTSARSGEP